MGQFQQTLTLDAELDHVTVRAAGGGSHQVVLELRRAGGVIKTRTLTIKQDGSAVLDDGGAIVAKPAPAALMTLIANFRAGIVALIDLAAAGGKLNL